MHHVVADLRVVDQQLPHAHTPTSMYNQDRFPSLLLSNRGVMLAGKSSPKPSCLALPQCSIDRTCTSPFATDILTEGRSFSHLFAATTLASEAIASWAPIPFWRKVSAFIHRLCDRSSTTIEQLWDGDGALYRYRQRQGQMQNRTFETD